MTSSSIRRAAAHRLSQERQRARRTTGDRPPGPAGPATLLTRCPLSALLLAGLAAWVLVLCLVSFAAPATAGIPAATTGFLSQLWQAQGVVSGLAFALAVFVFGLLPEARGRAIYGEFLRRSGTLPLVTAGIGSLIFDGLVLLGTGHQVRATATSAAHGWAVTVAVVIGVAAIASIVVLLGCTITAIDPASSNLAQADYRLRAVAEAVLAELLERASLQVILDPRTPGADLFTPIRPEAGLAIKAGGRADRAVHDVSLRRLARLKRHTASKGRRPPVVSVWPGRIVTTTMALITLDSASSLAERRRARRCVRLRAAPRDLLAVALDMSHAQTMDHIRAGRPVDADAGMQVMADLHEPMWQAYSAYGRRYDGDQIGIFWLYMPTVGERILASLAAQVRTAAVSDDDQIRAAAVRWPYLIARRALARRAAGSVEPSLRLLAQVYDAITSELSEGGRLPLPAAGPGRRRIAGVFARLLSFINVDLAREIDQAEQDSRAEAAVFEAAAFAVSQVSAANRVVLDMLRQAVDVRDATTLEGAIGQWKLPDSVLFSQAVAEMAGESVPAPDSRGEHSGALSGRELVMQAIVRARDELHGMKLLLFQHSLLAEQPPADSGQSMAGSASGPGTAPGSSPLSPEAAGAAAPVRDPCVSAALDGLAAGAMWPALQAAMTIAAASSPYRPRRDEEIIPAGVVITSYVDPASSVIDACILALLLRPGLIADAGPEKAFAYAHAEEIRRALGRVRGQRIAWLDKYGISAELAGQRAQQIQDQVTRIEHAARKEKDEQILAAPITAQVTARLQDEAVRAFRSADITTGLLSWGGNPPPPGGTSSEPADLPCVTMKAPRAALVDPDQADISHIAAWLGRALADQRLEQLLAAWRNRLQPQPISADDADATIRGALAKIREQDPGARIAVLAASRPYQIREYLNLSGTESQDQEEKNRSPSVPTTRDKMIDALGLRGSSCSWQLAGVLDEAPVVHTPLLENAIAVIDISRSCTIRLGSDCCDGSGIALSVIEPSPDNASGSDSGAPAGAGTTSPGSVPDSGLAPEDQIRAELLQVTIVLALTGSLSASNTAPGYLYQWKR